MRTATVRVPKRGTITARLRDYEYVDLFFGYSDTPYQTIRVWAYEGASPDMRLVVNAWVKEMDSDPSWPTWYEDILAATEQ